jgi:hypothetical protein
MKSDFMSTAGINSGGQQTKREVNPEEMRKFVE